MKLTLIGAINKSVKIKNCVEWNEFKAKWNGKPIPRKGSKAFKEFIADGERAQTAINSI